MKLKPVVCSNQIKKVVKQVLVIDIVTGEETIFPNMVRVEKHFGFKRGQVRGYILSGNLLQGRYKIKFL